MADDDDEIELKPGQAVFEPAPGSAKVGHVMDWNDPGGGKIRLKPGEIIRIVDSLSQEERRAIEQLRTLGPYKIHDARAQFLEELAAAARSQANAIQIADRYAFIEGGMQAPAQPMSASGILAGVLALSLLAAIGLQYVGRAPHPTPSAELESGSGEAGEAVSAVERRRRVGSYGATRLAGTVGQGEDAPRRDGDRPRRRRMDSVGGVPARAWVTANP